MTDTDKLFSYIKNCIVEDQKIPSLMDIQNDLDTSRVKIFDLDKYSVLTILYNFDDEHREEFFKYSIENGKALNSMEDLYAYCSIAEANVATNRLKKS